MIVIEGLTIPHKGHRKKEGLHSDKPHARHHSKRPVATGAQRQTVPSPLQDFVLLSGSPLFHERPKASDSKTNTTKVTTPAAKDQKASQETQENEAAVNQTISKLQGSELLSSQSGQAMEQHQESGGPTEKAGTGQVQGNGTEQHTLPESKEPVKAPSSFVQEMAQKIKEGLSQGKNQEKLNSSTNSTAPSVAITLETPANTNSSSGVMISLGNNTLNNVGKDKPTGQNASSKIVTISVNGQNAGTNNVKTNSSSVVETGPKENQTNTSIAADVKPDQSQNQKPGVEKFPFNIPGVRHYGNEKNDSKGVEATKQITDKETKLGLHENLGPNCHWKTSKGANGAVVTSVACSGEFHKPEKDKGDLDEAGKKPPPKDISKTGAGENLGSKQMTAKNTSVLETGGGEKETHMQSKSE